MADDRVAAAAESYHPLQAHTAADILRELQEALETEGVRPLLAILNARAPHRFTGIYRLEPPLLRNVHLFDRENPSLEVGADASLRETYCSITAFTAAPFATEDAAEDQRLADHPAAESTLSYCGVPLLDDAGVAVGTLCHFDLIPREIPEEEVSILEAMSEPVLRKLRVIGEFPAADPG